MCVYSVCVCAFCVCVCVCSDVYVHCGSVCICFVWFLCVDSDVRMSTVVLCVCVHVVYSIMLHTSMYVLYKWTAFALEISHLFPSFVAIACYGVCVSVLQITEHNEHTHITIHTQSGHIHIRNKTSKTHIVIPRTSSQYTYTYTHITHQNPRITHQKQTTYSKAIFAQQQVWISQY